VAFLKLIRYPNLGIVILTQALFYWFIKTVFKQDGINPVLDAPHFALLVFTTLCIAASGYIINDIYDYKIDLINKPDRMIIGKSIEIRSAWLYYFAVIGIGALVALYLAFYVQNLQLFLIYPVAIFIMWLYSKRLKKRPFSGNVVVALFSAFVAGIVWFAEREGFAALDSAQGIQMRNLFQFYMVFAFLSTLFREIIKDIEDYKGDIDNDCKTLPIVLGIQNARRISYVFGVLLLVSIGYWIGTQWKTFSTSLIILSVVLLIFPALYSIWTFSKAQSKKDYHRSSQTAKLLMVSGLVYLFLFLLLSTF